MEGIRLEGRNPNCQNAQTARAVIASNTPVLALKTKDTRGGNFVESAGNRTMEVL